MPQNNDSAALRIYGRWRDGYSTNVPGRSTPILVHVYDAPIPVGEPLFVGKRVQLIALSPISYRTRKPSLFYSNSYDVYDPQIVGCVVGAHMQRDGGPMLFAVDNERSVSTVGLVILAVPFIVGLSLAPVEDDCPREWVKELLAKVQSQVVMHITATVCDNLQKGETPIQVLQYPEPEEEEELDRAVNPPAQVWRPWLV